MNRSAEYVYLGDRLTREELRGQQCYANRRPDGKCIRGRNGKQGGGEAEMVDPATGEVTQQPAMATAGTEIGAGKRAKRKSK